MPALLLDPLTERGLFLLVTVENVQDFGVMGHGSWGADPFFEPLEPLALFVLEPNLAASPVSDWQQLFVTVQGCVDCLETPKSSTFGCAAEPQCTTATGFHAVGGDCAVCM